MSDYSFMKSGLGTGYEESGKLTEEYRETLEIMLSLFVSNAMINAAKYTEYCGRNGITKMDVEIGMKYEVFEFLNRGDIYEELAKIREELEKELEDCECESDSDEPCEHCKESNEEDKKQLEEMIIPDDELIEFSFINPDKITDENREFVEKFKAHYERYTSWEPDRPIEMAIKKAIDVMSNK